MFSKKRAGTLQLNLSSPFSLLPTPSVSSMNCFYVTLLSLLTLHHIATGLTDTSPKDLER